METFSFSPIVQQWFDDKLGKPTDPQRQGWPHIMRGEDTLIAAPTGSGKTLSAFMCAIDKLIVAGTEGRLGDHCEVLYVSPLKALGNDIQKNLSEPLAELQALSLKEGILMPEIRTAIRSGDTPAKDRSAMLRRPPHILITTPESLYLLLTAEKSCGILRNVSTVIIDEIHAIVGDKRGAHLSLSLERLESLNETRPQRIGLSATQKPIEEVAKYLVGTSRLDDRGEARCAVVDTGSHRKLDLQVDVPDMELGPVGTHELMDATYERIVELVGEHRSTIVFTNTRALVERVAHQLSERLGEGLVAAHHGSLSKEKRLAAEQDLKSGRVPVIVATASLELGIDVGHVELVCMLGSPRSLATFLQRVGRSGHWLGATPKGILFPLTRDELMQSVATLRAVKQGKLDRLCFPEKPLDILAQQMVAVCAGEGMDIESLWRLVKSAYPYRNLERTEFDQVLEMLSEGIATRKGRRGAHLHRDLVNAKVKGRRGARLAAITSGGAIPDTADYDVIEDPTGAFVGTLNEDFAIESMAGDIFLLGNHSWKIRRVERSKVRVEDAHGAPPTIPFWFGESPGRSYELSHEVAELRRELAQRVEKREEFLHWLSEEAGVKPDVAEQLLAYIRENLHVLGVVPTQDRIVAERFFDESGGMQLIVHAPFGARINRAWGLAMRKRFCVNFDFELQAAATDDGFVLSLGEQHSFPLESVFSFVRTATLEKDLTQAALQSPLFTNRWRWNAGRALAVLRFQGGKRVAVPIQRMQSEDLLAAVFPEQVGCQDNRGGGPIEAPDHPLVNETLRDCLTEAMDLEELQNIIAKIENGEIETVSVETPAPSPFSHEILNVRPYGFLDDAPLEERRARAVSMRRTLPNFKDGEGKLDDAAITEVVKQAWPDIRDADELHDLLLSITYLPLESVADWRGLVDELLEQKRVGIFSFSRENGMKASALVAAERKARLELIFADATFTREVENLDNKTFVREEVMAQSLLAWMECLGPVTLAQIEARLGLSKADINIALAKLEGSGLVMQGKFRPGAREVEWCERRLLARIHQLTLGKLRREMEPVSQSQFMRFLFRWQHVWPEAKLAGRDGVFQVIEQLQGYDCPAPAWEEQILPARIKGFNPDDLESLCLSGSLSWGKFRHKVAKRDKGEAKRKSAHVTRSAPLTFFRREQLDRLHVEAEELPELSGAATQVHEMLKARGASFMNEISAECGLLDIQVEEALWELVSKGLVHGDGLAGLRKLLHPTIKSWRITRQTGIGPRRYQTGSRALPVGRWALMRSIGAVDDEERLLFIANQLLTRYGVVFRELAYRENLARWRDLLGVYRHMEAKGEIRGGRFVDGFLGEQFALPEVVPLLRSLRNAEDEDLLMISSADPLNLVGTVIPGAKIPPTSKQFLLFKSGELLQAGLLADLKAKFQTDESRKREVN